MTIKETPMMSQYMSFKRQYPDKILLYRMGDFFETFGEDAEKTAKILNITLTKRNKSEDSAALAGFPHHAIDQYLPKLVHAGYCVVVVDQLEDPKFAKGIVKRGVTRIVTPGTMDITDETPKNLYVMSVYRGKNTDGIAICDISTGKLKVTHINNKKQQIESIINSFEPAEIVILEKETSVKTQEIPVQMLANNSFTVENAEKIINDHFKTKNIDSIGLNNSQEEMIATAMLLYYILDTQKTDPSHIKKIEFFKKEGTMVLDHSTIRNLELVSNAVNGTIKNTLFDVLNECKTIMGKRTLYSWILNPLLNKEKIDLRLNTVEKYVNDYAKLTEVRELLSGISDIERIVGKIGLNRVSARDYKALQYSLENAKKLDETTEKASKLQPLIDRIEELIHEEPAPTTGEGHIIKDGYNKEVDELRSISGNSKTWVKEFIETERQRTGIPSLKIGFTKVFGYYIEITKSHQAKVPADYIRKQTLVNAERYITEELKRKEEIILGAEDKLAKLELEIFQGFRSETEQYLQRLQSLAEDIAQLDVLSNFASIAINHNYVKPVIADIGQNNGAINVTNARHPVVERITQDAFVSNDIHVDTQENKMIILTGPNMSGKSTYIRQIALVVLMGQIGSFVPAEKAEISIADRIFTRVGAYDDLSSGRSTFMVEMDEAANITLNATQNSLVILDEIGRGTSTYDGVSLAWSIAEYLVSEVGARTFFATHYHELLKLADKVAVGVQNYNVAVDENIEKDEVIFLRKIIKGGTDRSYGIYVAKMAGLPDKIITRAKEILGGFEQEAMFSVRNEDESVKTDEGTNGKKNGKKVEEKKVQSVETNNDIYHFGLFDNVHTGIIGDLEGIDLNNLTPVEAFNKIMSWKKRLGV